MFAVYKGLVTHFSCSLQSTDNNPSVILFTVIALEKFAQTSKYMTSGVMTDDDESNCCMGCDVIYHNVGDSVSV